MTSRRRGAFREWIDSRLGLFGLIDTVLTRPLRGGASLGRSLGVALVVLFIVECLTGTLLALYYSPSVTDAWASVAYIELFVAGGATVRGIHHFATGAMVILAGLHVGYVVWQGGYKAPREPTWWVGLALLALLLAYPLTGYTLLWDQLAYWASKVRTGITGTIPGVGSYLKSLAIGGNDHGNLTLTRTYALHVLVLPALTAALVALRLALTWRTEGAQRGGAEGSLHDSGAAALEPYGARQLPYDLWVASACVGGVALIGAVFGAPLGAPADPTGNFGARPEWYFLPLFQLLKYFDGSLQIVGTVILPALVAAFLVGLPFFDRGSDLSLRARWPWVGGFLVLVLGAGGLGAQAVLSDLGDAGFEDSRAFAQREARRALELSVNGVPPEGGARMMTRDPLVRGERIFRQRCRSCHALEGYRPKEPKGPDLSAYGSKAWLRQLLIDPDGTRFFGNAEKIEGMPSFAKLSEDELDVLTEMLFSLRDHEGVVIEDHPRYDLIEAQECGDCHDFEEAFGVEGPSLAGYLSPKWIREMLDRPGASHLYGEMNEMPSFKTRLSEFDRDALVIFLLSLEGRAKRGEWPYADPSDS